MIKVVCCSPEGIRSKLIHKGDGVIKSIEIRKPEKLKLAPAPAPEKPKDPPQRKVTFQPPEKPKDEKKGAEKAKPPPEKSKEPEKPPKTADQPKADKPAEKPPAPAPAPALPAQVIAPAPATGYPHFAPLAVCCKPCYEMGHGGPCQHSYGVPYQPQPSPYDGYVRLLPSYGEPSYGDWSSRCRCNRSYGCRCHHEYFTEENPSCTKTCPENKGNNIR